MDEVGRGALACLLVEKSLSEFLEGNRLAQHMEHSNQDLMRDGHGGAQRAPTGLQPVVLVLVVTALLAGGADGSLNEGRLEVNVALAGCRVLLFPGTLVIAGADPGPCSQALGVAEHGHVDTDLRDDRYRDPVVDAGNLPEQAPLRLVGLSLLRDALVQITQICLDRLNPSQMEGQQVAVMLAEPAVERQSGSSLRRKLRFARSAISCVLAVFSTMAFII